MATAKSPTITIYGYKTNNDYNKITGYIQWTYIYNATDSSIRFRLSVTHVDFVVTSCSTGQWASSVTTTAKNNFKHMQVKNDVVTATYPIQAGTSTMKIRSATSTRQFSLKTTNWAKGDIISIFDGTNSSIMPRQPSDSTFSSEFKFRIDVAGVSSTNYDTHTTCTTTVKQSLTARTVSEINFSANHPVLAASDVTTPATRNVTINHTLSNPGECTTTADETYNFVGWFTDRECTEQVSFPLMIEAWPYTRILYGGWRSASIGIGESIPVKITKTGICKAEGTTSTIPFTRANAAYSFVHTDNIMGFVEINNETAKIYNGAIEVNQFYEI